MKILQMEVGSLGTNCYVVYCETTNKAAVIDPGGDAADILAVIRKHNLSVEYIINTHGHADHSAGNAAIKKATGAAVLIHEADAPLLTNPARNLSLFVGGSTDIQPADRLLVDGDSIVFGQVCLGVLYTPGHTPGGICLSTEGVLFSGDTLFKESIGRTDLPGGSYSQLIHSIKAKLTDLADATRVLPGHGPETTIGWERRMNPFIQ